jgi:hypothetical protein
MFRTVRLSIIRNLFNVHSAMEYVIQGCRQLLNRARMGLQWINSWWWTDKLSETCRVSWQNKFMKLVHLVSIITKKFVTMHGHMNVKKKSQPLFGFGWITPSDMYCRKLNNNNNLEVHTLPIVQIYRILTGILFVRSPELILNLTNINLPIYPLITNLIWFRTRIFGNNTHTVYKILPPLLHDVGAAYNLLFRFTIQHVWELKKRHKNINFIELMQRLLHA